ncbi:MAG: aminopeptidase N, partial [Pseudomonadota bacterium]
MRDAAPQPIYLKDYTPFAYEIEDVSLTFRLHPTATRVICRIAFRPNPAATDKRFFLHGEDLTLISAKIDGADITPRMVDGGLECDAPVGDFVWEAEVEINPEANTALEGLYMSNGMYSTQCEAEGFRKITFYPDRPDVMATFSVRIEGSEPVLLSNGNPGATGEGFAEWHDPWPKPAYLFALVAGELLNHPGSFTTASGRAVELNIWVRPGDEHKCDFAMEALIKSMTWDEEVYGREYDLDIFNIVAVDDFNMGAMENKGLNIFNSSAVLASPDTSTDMNFERIEGIIAHEYFHNWTGNRITCRDWFQLCLKEGLTVFRDAEFTSDMRSEPVKRIGDVIALRARQFREDNGPLAHPVRPSSFVEINNFYTATVYDKGAELIGMLKTLVGDAAYSKALDLYFDRHDGDAATIEDWLKVFEDATGRDLNQFKRWYEDAGTPRLSVTQTHEGDRFTLTFEQMTPPSPGQDEKPPRVIPIAVGLIAPDGSEAMETTVLEMTEARQSFHFDGHAA